MKNLTQVLLEFSDAKFSYNGRTDCCAFAGAVVQAIHGYNPMDTFLYTTKAGAFEVIERAGGLVHAVSDRLGNPLPVTDVEDGDVLAAVQTNGDWIVGVALGGRMAVKTKNSLTDWPLEFASVRWRPQCQSQ